MNIDRFKPVLLIALALLALAMLLLLPDLAVACPACKETVRGQAGSELSAGFNVTVFGLIGMVFGLFATVAAIVMRAYRKRNA